MRSKKIHVESSVGSSSSSRSSTSAQLGAAHCQVSSSSSAQRGTGRCQVSSSFSSTPGERSAGPCQHSGPASEPVLGRCPTAPRLAPKLPQRLRSLFRAAPSPETEAQPSDGWLLPAPTEPRRETRLKEPRLSAVKVKVGRFLRGGPASGSGEVEAIAALHVDAKPAGQESQEGFGRAALVTTSFDVSEAAAAEVDEAAATTSNEGQQSALSMVQHGSWSSSVLDDVDPEVAALLGVQMGPCALKGVLCHGRLGPLYFTTRSACGFREVVKVIDKSNVSRGHVANELRFVQKLRHPNVARILGAIHAPHHVFIRMTFGGQRNLCHFMHGGRRPTAQQVCRVGAQLAGGLAYCHAEGVAHRDVSPANIAVSNDGKQVTLVGFGSAISLGEVCSDVAGTMPFLAPEVIEAAGPGVLAPYEPAGADVWSCGVVLLELLEGSGCTATALGWGPGFADGASVEPSAARAGELRELLAHRGAAADIFGGLAASAEDWGFEEELLEVLSRTLEVEPRWRWTSAELAQSDWLRRGEVPLAA